MARLQILQDPGVSLPWRGLEIPLVTAAAEIAVPLGEVSYPDLVIPNAAAQPPGNVGHMPPAHLDLWLSAAAAVVHEHQHFGTSRLRTRRAIFVTFSFSFWPVGTVSLTP